MTDLFSVRLPVVEQLFDRMAEATNYRLRGDRKLAATWHGRAEDNVTAIRLMQLIEQQGRPATPIEQSYLARFVGFGASDLANGVFPVRGTACKAGFEQVVSDLSAATSPAEWAALARATQYAHFTPEWIVRAMWEGVRRLGFRGGTVLEPGFGVGIFASLMPDDMAQSSVVTGIEADPITARIARLLHPRADVREADFTEPALLLPQHALAIGNPPFSDRVVRGAGAKTTGMALHEFFIWRAVQALEPGGVGAFVVSRHLMDKPNSRCRDAVSDLANFLGAVRLPEGALRAEAGTDVVVDLIFLRRRADEASPAGERWASTSTTSACPAAGEINRYWIGHPHMVLGDHATTSSQWGEVYTCETSDRIDEDLAYALTLAIRHIGAEPVEQQPHDLQIAAVPAPSAGKGGGSALLRPPSAARVAVRVGRASDGSTVKEGSYYVAPEDGLLYQVVRATPQPITVKAGRGTEGMWASHAAIIRGLIPVRDAVRDVLRAQEADQPWEAAQARLEAAYSGFVRRHGPVNKMLVSRSEPDEDGDVVERSRRPNLAPFLDDPDCWLVSAIEEYDPATHRATRGPIFTQRVIAPAPEVVVHTAADALAVVLNEAGGVDLDRVAQIRGSHRAEVIAELGDAIYLNPANMEWETDDAYLSGQVRTKLNEARAAATQDAQYERNVRALEAVQPADLRPSEISARLGAPWIGPSDVMEFVIEVLGVATSIDHTPGIASWSVQMAPFRGATGRSEWGTARRDAGLLLEDALNNRVPQVYDIEVSHGVSVATLNPAATEAAKEKLAKIKAAFSSWVWSDTIRADRLARTYNDLFNNLVPRRFTGAHLALPGISSTFTPRAHQRRVVWRIVAAGSSYIAHEVGAGKTSAIVMACMEQRRLGLVSKPMLTVPGHCLAQFAREWMQIYPNARILVADETNFSKHKRARFLARAATGQWDAIIITHSAFRFISVPDGFEREMIAEQIDTYEEMLTRVATDDRVSRKRLERLKDGLRERLRALRTRKDDMLTLGEIGIDQIIVDEAQEFRKLSFATNMSSLRGIDPDGSQRAWDLFLKVRFIEREQPRRPLVLSSGTPITNTMGEMYTLQRFMQPEMLADRGVQEFDAWALTFGDTRTELELQPSGLYKPVTRFSEFVNVPELVAMFRSVADVVQKSDLREYVRLPRVKTGQRQLVTRAGSADFKQYQGVLARRIAAIQARGGKPKKGEDILLAVITDGRHAAIDLRLVGHLQDEPENKLNALVENVHRLWLETAEATYEGPDGKPMDRRGAVQMVFCDLATLAAEDTRGFSAYRWIKDRLVALGVPATDIAIMQQHKNSAAKQKLLDSVNAGWVRVLLGSSETMGTGVNAQARLVALHHLDVPWLPSQIGQREGRIERQGNQNEEIEIYAYATLGSLDASMWQTNERKARFIAAVLSGDRSVRTLEDLEASASSQFAMAKAIASGDDRLVQKAGLEADIARLWRQHDAHYDDQASVRFEVQNAEARAAAAERQIAELEQDLAVYQPRHGEAFEMVVLGQTYTDAKPAGAALLSHMRGLEHRRRPGTQEVGSFCGFPLTVTTIAVRKELFGDEDRPPVTVDLTLERAGGGKDFTLQSNTGAAGLVARIEDNLSGMAFDLALQRQALASALKRAADYRPRLGGAFAYQADLDAKEAELVALDADLAATEAPVAA